MLRVILFFVLAVFTSFSVSIAGDRPLVGVYYFPGWHSVMSLRPQDTWKPIKSYPEREPMLGWYDESSVSTMEQQVASMSNYGIDYMVYDWYWRNDSSMGVAFNQPIDSYLLSHNRNLIKFAILWANHTQVPSSIEQYKLIVNYWIDHYFSEDNYLVVEGKPVVFIFSPADMRSHAKKLGVDTNYLLEMAKKMVIDAGYKGVYFVGSANAIARDVNELMPREGYDAISAYNYQFGLSGKYERRTSSHSYKELVSGYSETWKWILNNSKLPYILPVTSGWDRRPWGGSKDPLADLAVSTPVQFRKHLKEAKKALNTTKKNNSNMLVICCWNEFGEGSYIQPTKYYEYQYLEQILNVFGRSR